MFNWINKPNLYTLGWCVYFYQGIFFPDGFIAIKLLLIVLLVVSLYYVFIANTQYKIPAYLIGLNALLFLFTIYGLYLTMIPFDHNPVPGSEYLKQIYVSLLPIYAFYVFSKEKRMTTKSIQTWALIFISLTIIYYFVSRQIILQRALLAQITKEEFTNNIGYSFVALIPLSLFFKKYIVWQYVILGVCFAFMVMAMKRGAILIGGISIILIIWKSIKMSNFKTKIGIIILSIVLLIVCGVFVKYRMETSDYFIQRIEQSSEGDSSGRNRIYKFYLNFFLEKNSPNQLLLGSGANSTLQLIGYAHNDWLEIAINHGLLGVLTFIFYWSMFAKTAWNGRIKQTEKLILQILFIDFFLRTFFSMSYREMQVDTQLILGYCLTKEFRDEQINYCN